MKKKTNTWLLILFYRTSQPKFRNRMLALFVANLLLFTDSWAQCLPLPDSLRGVEISAINSPCINGKSGEIQITNSTRFVLEYSIDNRTFSTNPKFSGLLPGLYTIHIRDVSGNVHCVEKEIPASQKLEVIPTGKSDETCYERRDGRFSFTIQGGTKPYAIQIKTPYQQTPQSLKAGDTSLTKLGPGEYTLTVSDGNDCVATYPFYIVRAEKLSIDKVSATDATSSLKDDGQIIVRVEGATHHTGMV